MADNFEIKIKNLGEVKQYLKDLPDDTFVQAKKVFQKAVINADATVKRNFGFKIQSRSGSLRRSLGTSVSGNDLDSLRASTYGAAFAGGSALVYTLAQEFGATIRAKNKYRNVPGGPYLNIPLKPNKTAAGVTRLTAKTVFSLGGYIQRTARKKWGVFLKGQMMFVLVKKVQLKPRLGMRKAADDEIPTILSQLVDLIGED